MASTAKVTAPCAPAGAGIALLGGFRLLGHPGTTLSNSCQRLLALLALRRSLDRSTAAGLLWPDYTESRAVHSLRSAVWRLHHSVDGILAVTRREISLVPHIGVDTEELDEHFRRLRDGCSPDQAVAVVDYSVGGLLPGWSDDWVVVDRERVRQVHLQTLTMLSRAFAAAGDLDRAVLTAYRAAQVDPLRESTHRLLLELHIAAGDYAEALRRHEEFRQILVAELGILPSPHAQVILERIPTEARPLRSRRAGRDARMTASAHDAPDVGSRRVRHEP